MPAGVAVVAAKRFYFGEGCEGGVSMFLEEVAAAELVERRSGGVDGGANGDGDGDETGRYRLAGRVVRSVEDGSSNIRDVVLVHWVQLDDM